MYEHAHQNIHHHDLQRYAKGECLELLFSGHQENDKDI